MATNMTHEQITNVYEESVRLVSGFPVESNARSCQVGLEIVGMLKVIAHVLVDLANGDQPQAIAIAQSASASKAK